MQCEKQSGGCGSGHTLVRTEWSLPLRYQAMLKGTKTTVVSIAARELKSSGGREGSAPPANRLLTPDQVFLRASGLS